MYLCMFVQMVSSLFLKHSETLSQQRSNMRRSSTARRFQANTVSAKFQSSLQELLEKMERFSITPLTELLGCRRNQHKTVKNIVSLRLAIVGRVKILGIMCSSQPCSTYVSIELWQTHEPFTHKVGHLADNKCTNPFRKHSFVHSHLSVTGVTLILSDASSQTIIRYICMYLHLKSHTV